MSSLSVEQLEKDLKRLGITWVGLGKKLGLARSTTSQWKLSGRIPARHIQPILKITRRGSKSYSVASIAKKMKEKGLKQTELSVKLGLSSNAFAVWKRRGEIPEKHFDAIEDLFSKVVSQKTIFEHAIERKAVKKVRITKDNIDKINFLAIWRRL